MAENSKIEWTNSANVFGHQNAVYKNIARLNTAPIQPIPNIEMPLTAVAGTAGRDKVAIASVSTFLDRNDVIDRVGVTLAIRTFPVEKRIDKRFLGGRRHRGIATPFRGMRPHGKSQRRATFIEIPSFSPKTRPASSLGDNYLAHIQPIFTAPAPCEAVFTHRLSHTGAINIGTSAKTTFGVKPVVPRFVFREEFNRPPYRAFPAAFESHINAMHISLKRDTSSTGSDFEDSKVTSHGSILPNVRLKQWA